MLTGEFDADEAESPAALREAYVTVIRETIESVGAETVTKETTVDGADVTALVDGRTPELTLAEASEILACGAGRPDAETIEREALDLLLLAMTAAVVDVETVASELGGDVEPSTVHAKVEGRMPVTLSEYARLHWVLEDRR